MGIAVNFKILELVHQSLMRKEPSQTYGSKGERDGRSHTPLVVWKDGERG